MVSDSLTHEQADRIFHALADSTRRDIISRALRSEHSVSELARLYPMSFAAVQKHVAVLESAGLVTKRRQGRQRLVVGNIDAIRRATRALDRLEALWRARIDRMDDILVSQKQGGRSR